MKTLFGNNGSFANFGSVAMQPVAATTIAHQVQQQTSILSHPSAAGVVPVRHAALSIPIMLHNTNQIQMIRRPTLTNIANLLSTDRRFIFPIHTTFNNIMPTHALTLDAGRVYDPRLTQGFVTTTTKFQPFEQLTGIAHERPEIVMLTNFQPLFNHDVSHTAPHFIGIFEDMGLYHFMTDAGRYIDAQMHIRNLRTYNIYHNIRMLRHRYVNVHQLFLRRTDDFSQALNHLKDDASFLLNLVRIIESQKHQLDLRHDLYLVDPHDIGEWIIQNFSQFHLSISPAEMPSVLSRLIEIGHRRQYNCVDMLIDLGYNPDSVKNVFASTKIWMQLTVELKNMMQHHSLKFLDIDPTYQRHDNNPSTILVPPVRYFGLASNLPSLPTLDELINLQIGNAAKTINLLLPAFSSIYQNVYFKNEEARIAGLAHLLSREYKYSNALSKPALQSALQKFYGYTVTTSGNSTVFDAVFGRHGNNITDLPTTQDTSLATLAYWQNQFAASAAQQAAGQRIAVVNFESKYIEGDTGTLSPGGDFYFERILNPFQTTNPNGAPSGISFDTSGLDGLAEFQLDPQLNALSTIIDGFNMLNLPAEPDRSKWGTRLDTEAGFLNDPSDTVWDMVTQLINYHTGEALTPVVNDRLGAVYSQARNDTRVKTILFLYTLSRISRNYTHNVPFFASASTADNTPLVDYLIEQLISALEASVPETRSTIQLVTQRGLDRGLNTAAMTHDSIKHALKSGTAMTLMIEHFMSKVIDQFRTKTSAITGNFTRYNGYLDTIMMMVAFDFAIATVARYSNQHLVGAHRGLTLFSQGQVTFAVSQTTTNHNASFSELLQRLANEGNISRQLVMTVLNVMRKLSGSVKGISNYLKSPEAQNKLQEIATVLGNDQDMIKMLFSEQQIMLLASTVESLVTAHNHGIHGTRSPADRSYHDDGSNANKEITLLDESEVPPAMRDALFGYFGTSNFASLEANNNRILTVGIPLGFTQRLKQKVNIRNQKRATFENKRNDIVQVTVYKVDMQNAEIIYRPLRFLFELARFPTRYTTAHWLPIRQQPSLNDVINAIPTQCFTQNPDSGTASSISSGVEYASTAIAESEGVKGARAAFDDPAYSFLTPAQRGEILHNHIVSQLLEVYIKLMTGINVAEYNYDMVEPPPHHEASFVKTMVDHTVAHISNHVAAQNAQPHAANNPQGGVLFSTTAGRPLTAVKGGFTNRAASHPILSNPAGVAGNVSPESFYRGASPPNAPVQSLEQQAVIGNVGANMDLLSHRHVPLVLSHFKTISSFANTMSSVSQIDSLNKKVMTPKQFDRVFNIIIDPRQFQIDVAKTIHTPFGKQALDLLLRHGDIVSVYEGSAYPFFRSYGKTITAETESVLEGRSFLQGRFTPNINNFAFRDRDKNEGDLITDKYFVTIETLNEEDQV